MTDHCPQLAALVADHNKARHAAAEDPAVFGRRLADASAARHQARWAPAFARAEAVIRLQGSAPPMPAAAADRVEGAPMIDAARFNDPLGLNRRR